MQDPNKGEKHRVGLLRPLPCGSGAGGGREGVWLSTNDCSLGPGPGLKTKIEQSQPPALGGENEALRWASAPHPTYVHILIPQSCHVSRFGQRVSADVKMLVKDLEVRSSWTTQVGPKSSDKCPMRDRRGKGRVAGHMGTEAETAVMRRQAKEHLEAQKLEEAGEPPLEPPEGAQPC